MRCMLGNLSPKHYQSQPVGSLTYPQAELRHPEEIETWVDRRVERRQENSSQ